MPFYKDQLERTIELQKVPSRIVSLVPSQTELLYNLGLEQEVTGITKFCVHPHQWFKTKTRIGGTKKLNINKITGLMPDLILANKEENVQEQIQELSKQFPVWISDVNTLQDAYALIASVGEILEKEKVAQELIKQIKENFFQLKPVNCKLRTAYFIWQQPYMTVGGDTFISNMLQQAGFENIFKDQKRYPEVSISQLQTANCQLLLLSSEPFPFQQKHIDELQPLLPGTKIILADGEIFSWYGSRLLKAPEYFTHLQQQIQALSLF